MNDTERKQWVENDEGLYCCYRTSRKPLTRFVRDNREFIDEVIGNVTTGRRPAHYLEYGRIG